MSNVILIPLLLLGSTLPSLAVLGVVTLSHSFRRPFYIGVAWILATCLGAAVWVYGYQQHPGWNMYTNNVAAFFLVVLNMIVGASIVGGIKKFDANYEVTREVRLGNVRPLDRRRGA